MFTSIDTNALAVNPLFSLGNGSVGIDGGVAYSAGTIPAIMFRSLVALGGDKGSFHFFKDVKIPSDEQVFRHVGYGVGRIITQGPDRL